jgi:hypothetical protein
VGVGRCHANVDGCVASSALSHYLPTPHPTLPHKGEGLHHAAACFPHKTRVAIRAPSASAFSFAHMMVG